MLAEAGARTAAKRINARARIHHTHSPAAPSTRPATQRPSNTAHSRPHTAHNARAKRCRERADATPTAGACRWCARRRCARCHRASRRAFRRARLPPAAKLAIEPVVAATDAARTRRALGAAPAAAAEPAAAAPADVNLGDDPVPSSLQPSPRARQEAAIGLQAQAGAPHAQGQHISTRRARGRAGGESSA